MDMPPLRLHPELGARPSLRENGMTIEPLFAWYDLWVGAFWDRAKRKLYIFPVPCFGVVITFK